MWVLAAVSAQLRCADAAAMGARAAARGDPPADVAAVVGSVAPEGARVEVERVGDRVRVTVRATVRPFSGLAAVGALDVSGQGTALAEDAPGPDG